ncbi:response regulator transcription factor [Sphingomonas montanisoli]|uniref:Response regulator transcription factor n=1 Tax=Sphingomonas montanisoli TaxID=2606412 RepID=A0A5D9CD01_9SPHN|nr:response regulator transcription factor [Sphingomonas montanisoli]TZG27985.1 response regulator transcription factor [Sphingomonas montanisoli]
MTLGRILIADDHPLINEGIQIALRVHQPGYVVDVAGSIADAEVLIQQHNDYRLLLLDYELPDSNGFNGFFKLQHLLGRVPIAIISAHDSKQILSAARAVGASGFISKRQPLDAIVAAISMVLRGGSFFPPVDDGADEAEQLRKRIDSLSNAQRRVLMALAHGDLNKQIAAELGVTEATIKAHLSAIFRKLGVTNRTQAILMVRPLTGAMP